MLDISLKNQQGTYFPGQEIDGSIILNLTSEACISSIVVYFTGIGVLGKDEAQIKENLKQELYVDHVIQVLGSEDTCEKDVKMKVKMDVGSHTFPFKYTLPQKIPGSFESPNGYVRYSIAAQVEEVDVGLKSTVTFFTVNALLDLNKIPKCQQPSTDWAQQDVCLFCFKCGPVSAVLNVPRKGFVSGEHIMINAEINNLHNKPISFVKATLVQVIKYHYKTGPKKIKRAVAEVVRGTVMPRESQVWREELILIPPVVASKLTHCNLIDIWYNLYFHVSSSGLAAGETLKLLKVPIIIGTIPLRQQAEQLEMGTGEPLLSLLPSPSTEPCIFGPYSITDERSEDHISFSPLYVTYSSKTDSVLELNT